MHILFALYLSSFIHPINALSIKYLPGIHIDMGCSEMRIPPYRDCFPQISFGLKCILRYHSGSEDTIAMKQPLHFFLKCLYTSLHLLNPQFLLESRLQGVTEIRALKEGM